jgi:Domain of unknown function (DUF1844)
MFPLGSLHLTGIRSGRRPTGALRSLPLADEPKLIIDSDWKSQAQAEKEKLAEKAAPKVDAAEMRDIGFEDLVGMLATNTLSYLGYVPDPYTGQAMVSIEYAKLHIDLLGVLEAKTKGNLTPEEEASFTKTLTQLRMAFVEVSKAVAKAVKEGKIKPVSAQGMGDPMGGTVAGKIGPEGSGLITP